MLSCPSLCSVLMYKYVQHAGYQASIAFVPRYAHTDRAAVYSRVTFVVYVDVF
jgi:hypothetical protein